MASSVVLSNNADQEVEVLITDSKGNQTRTQVGVNSEANIPVASGQVGSYYMYIYMYYFLF